MPPEVEQANPERVRLRDGAELLIRQVTPEDKELLAKGFARLSAESRYHRFFRPVDRLSERDLVYLTEIDHHDHEALAAIDPESGELVGVSRYVRSDERSEAEVSVVVGDDWQRRGVATTLLEHLTERAREAGVTHFVALVMDENKEVMVLFDHRVPDHPKPRRSASGHIELVIDLPERGVPGSNLGRVLGTVARTAVVVNPYRVMRAAIRRWRGE